MKAIKAALARVQGHRLCHLRQVSLDLLSLQDTVRIQEAVLDISIALSEVTSDNLEMKTFLETMLSS